MFDIYSQSDERAARTEKWDADRIERELLEIERARATCGCER
jgi:hypothetical protein